jgi:hypothetical protein
LKASFQAKEVLLACEAAGLFDDRRANVPVIPPELRFKAQAIR